MANLIRNPKDFLSGLMFLTFGGGAIFLGQDYEVGQAVRMGPGYFPMLLAGLLCLVGAVCMVRSLAVAGTPMEKLAFKPLILIVLSTVVFGLLLRHAGLVAALAASILLSALASSQFSARNTALTIVLLTAFCYLVFLKGLGLPIPVLGPWLGG
jgi:Tripartite tricarboxylate transporter TctB family